MSSSWPRASRCSGSADVAIRLTKVDTKKNRFTLQLVADNRSVEKKDKSVNEPLQFYVARARVPYEIVVNTVSKDQVSRLSGDTEGAGGAVNWVMSNE